MDLSNKHVLVTGADGFIGSHLVEHLLGAGARVRALSLYNSFNDWGWLEDIQRLNEVTVVTGDVRDPHFCLTLVKGMDVVFHLAALIPIPYSYRAPDSYVDTNIKGTLNLCQAARESGVVKFIQISSSEVYGTARYVPMDEAHPLTPQSPYSASKIGADAMALSFYHAFQLPVVIARPFNTYGPRQSARAVIPTIITQLASGCEEIALGDTRTTRDFTFVRDTCRGLSAVACLDEGIGEVFHIGSNQEISIGDLAGLIGELMGKPIRLRVDPARLRPEKSEVLRLRCANEKLRRASGFQPEIPLRDGLAETVKWFSQEANLKWYKGQLYNV